MEVILLERVDKLGHMGEVIRVKDGYARNFLLRQGKALRATDANKARYERDKAMLEARSAERRKGAEGESAKLDGKSFVILRQAGESGQLYGSVSTRDIAALLTEAGFLVDRGQIALNAPIKMIGLHPVPVGLHPEVSSKITINVARNSDEAERLARGEDVTVRREAGAEDEEAAAATALAAETFFEQPPPAEAGEPAQGEGTEKAG